MRFWTLQRATGIGLACGFAALLIAALIGWRSLVWPYAVLLAVTALCGASVLWITAEDVRRRGRGGKMRAIRTFDVAIGLALLLPSGFALRQAWPALGL